MASTKVSLKLKLLVDRNANRVLFAEANKDFVDFLFMIFSLPIGTVVKLLTKDSMVGCLGKLYDSVERLDETYMLPNQSKDSVLHPKVQIQTDVAFLLPGVESSSTKRNFGFASGSTSPPFLFSSGSAFGSTSTGATGSTSTGVRGFVKEVVTYMVMDDLAVSPMSTISGITLLNKFSVKDVGALEERVVELGTNEGLKILRESMQSTTVLTSVFLGEKGMDIPF